MLTILVGLSRVFCDLHHLIDILGSMVIAAGVGGLAYQIIKLGYILLDDL